MPFPGTRVIPAGWSQHHRPTAAGGMNAVAQLHDFGSDVPTYDPATFDSTGSDTPPVWEGAARVQPLLDVHAGDQAGQEVTARSYLVQLTEVGVELPDVVQGWTLVVSVCPNDPYLVGRHLTITDVQYGSERFTRDVVVQDNLG